MPIPNQENKKKKKIGDYYPTPGEKRRKKKERNSKEGRVDKLKVRRSNYDELK